MSSMSKDVTIFFHHFSLFVLELFPPKKNYGDKAPSKHQHEQKYHSPFNVEF